jgi:hypothetical protein
LKNLPPHSNAIAVAETEMPRSCSIFMKSEAGASGLALGADLTGLLERAAATAKSFSVEGLVFPASSGRGEMIANCADGDLRRQAGVVAEGRGGVGHGEGR